ncbi:hypothetical protein [Laceyella putida]|uniref:DUF3899 domain-containing protein n=1 Tax=Laceyella putida TaxID=110101 RepID=A0ABW2RQ52_9BACL
MFRIIRPHLVYILISFIAYGLMFCVAQSYQWIQGLYLEAIITSAVATLVYWLAAQYFIKPIELDLNSFIVKKRQIIRKDCKKKRVTFMKSPTYLETSLQVFVRDFHIREMPVRVVMEALLAK